MMENLLAWGLTTLVTAFVGSYLASYLKKKGENLATHEDIGKLVEQMQAVTQATKEIEAKISNEVWNRQKQWEVRRDVIFETVKQLGEVQANFAALVAYGFTLSITTDTTQRETYLLKKQQSTEAYNAAFLGLCKSLHIVSLVCGPEVKRELLNIQRIILTNSMKMSLSETPDPGKVTKELADAMEHVVDAIRKELGIEPLPTLVKPQSRESSAVQAPAPPGQG